MDSPTVLTLRIPAFEAAIHKAADPGLSSRPVVVATSFKQLGRVVAACPLAREAGVIDDMHFPAARARCPDAAFFMPDRQLAAEVIGELTRRAAAFTPLVEPGGAGTMLLDTRGTERLWGEGARVAELLQKDVLGGLHLPAATGLSVCRPWSLLASRAAGDNGFCLVAPGEENEFLRHIPVDWIDGLAPQTRTRLVELNLRSVGQLRQFSRTELLRQFGPACGQIMWSVVNPGWGDILSPGCQQTRQDPSDHTVRLEAALAEAMVVEDRLRLVTGTLASHAAATLRRRNLGAGRLRLTLLHADGVVKTAHGRTGGHIQAEAELVDLARRLLARIFRRRVRVVRLWLTAENLAEPERQGVLFPVADGRPPRLLTAVDDIRRRYGEHSVGSAALLGGRDHLRLERRVS